MSGLMELAYLLAAVFFIIGLKWLSSPATARNGNALASMGMLIAIVVTLFEQRIVGFSGILIGIIIGAAGGGVVVVGILLALYCMKMRRKQGGKAAVQAPKVVQQAHV